jgi:hypothetical protein
MFMLFLFKEFESDFFKFEEAEKVRDGFQPCFSEFVIGKNGFHSVPKGLAVIPAAEMAEFMNQYIFVNGLFCEDEPPVQVEIQFVGTAAPPCLHILDPDLVDFKVIGIGVILDHIVKCLEGVVVIFFLDDFQDFFFFGEERVDVHDNSVFMDCHLEIRYVFIFDDMQRYFFSFKRQMPLVFKDKIR